MFLSVRPQFNAHLVSTDAATATSLRSKDMSRSRRPDQRRVLRLPTRDPRPDRARRRARRGDVRAADRRARAGRVPVRRLLRRRWTRSRTGSASRRCTSPARRRGSMYGSTASSPEPTLRCVLSLSAAEPLRRILAIGCHADDIEIGCGGTLLTLARANAALEVDWVVLAAPGARGEEARASAEAFLAGFAAARVEVHGIPRRVPALRRRRGQGGVRGSEGASRPADRAHPRAVTTSIRITGSRAS